MALKFLLLLLACSSLHKDLYASGECDGLDALGPGGLREEGASLVAASSRMMRCMEKTTSACDVFGPMGVGLFRAERRTGLSHLY